MVHEQNVLTSLDYATVYSTHSNSSDERAVFKRSDEHLSRTLDDLWCRDIVDDGIEQRQHIVGRLFPVIAHPALLGRTEDSDKVKLVFRSAKVEHEVEYLVLCDVGCAVRLVHLVDHHDRLQSNLDRLLKYETSLRHRSLESIDEEDTAIGHIEHALHLATEVGVTRSIDDVDFSTLIVYRYIL